MPNKASAPKRPHLECVSRDRNPLHTSRFKGDLGSEGSAWLQLSEMPLWEKARVALQSQPPLGLGFHP